MFPMGTNLMCPTRTDRYGTAHAWTDRYGAAQARAAHLVADDKKETFEEQAHAQTSHAFCVHGLGLKGLGLKGLGFRV